MGKGDYLKSCPGCHAKPLIRRYLVRPGRDLNPRGQGRAAKKILTEYVCPSCGWTSIRRAWEGSGVLEERPSPVDV